MKHLRFAAVMLLLLAGLCSCGRYDDTLPPEITDNNTVDDTERVDSFEKWVYKGDGGEIVVPEGVRALDGTSFGENPERITSVHLPASLINIDPEAFSKVISLEKITVHPDNTDFAAVGNGIVSKNAGAMFYPPAKELDNDLGFGDAVYRLDSVEGLKEYVSRIYIGPAEIRVRCAPYQSDGQTCFYCYATYVSAFGHKVFLNDWYDIDLYAPQLRVYCTEDAVAVSVGRYTGIISEKVVLDPEYTSIGNDCADSFTSYNVPVIRYEAREDGRMGYIKSPEKYTFIYSVDDVIRYCVGFDEFCRETGYITIEDDKIEYHPEQTYTFAEIFDKEGEISGWDTFSENYKYVLAEAGLPEDTDIYGWIAYNATIYERAG